MSGGRALDYGDTATSRPAGKALGYGKGALRAPGSGSDAATSDQLMRSAADPQATVADLPPAAEGLHPPAILARFNAVALDPGDLDAARAVASLGLGRLANQARARYRAVLLARMIHATGEADLEATAIPFLATLLGGGEITPVTEDFARRVLGAAPAVNAPAPGDDRRLPYDARAAFELLRQLAAAADAAPGSRWATGWHRLAPALDALFQPGVAGPRLLGGTIERPGADVFGIVAIARGASGPGASRVQGAIVSALGNGIIGGLQGLTRYRKASDRPDLRLDIRNPRNVLLHTDAYRRDVDTLARLVADILPRHDSLRHARVAGVQQAFLLMLLFLEEDHLEQALPFAIAQVSRSFAHRARNQPGRIDEWGVRLGFIVAAIQSALTEAMDSPRQWANAVTAAGAIASLVPDIPNKVTVAVTILSALASMTMGTIDSRRGARARNARDAALANVGDMADAEADRAFSDGQLLARFIGMRLAGTNEARRAYGLPTM